MKKQFYLSAAFVTLALAASGSPLRAQDSSQMAYAPEASAGAPKAAPKKPHKVWTDDDVTLVRTDADKFLDQKEAAAKAAAATTTAVAKQEKSSKPQEHVGAPPVLSNPKSVDDADRMVAWEDRDLAAQQEFVDKLRTQLQQASPEDRDRIQKQLDERLKIVEEVKKERDSLLTQKTTIEKKAAANASTDAPAAGTPVAQ